MRALVIGGGIGGLSVSLALRRIGIDVRVCGQAAEIKKLGAGISIKRKTDRDSRQDFS